MTTLKYIIIKYIEQVRKLANLLIFTTQNEFINRNFLIYDIIQIKKIVYLEVNYFL
jgi:hypothetical protein